MTITPRCYFWQFIIFAPFGQIIIRAKINFANANIIINSLKVHLGEIGTWLQLGI